MFPATTSGPGAATATCEVEVVDANVRFAMPVGECILDAALAQGIRLPHQCRGASCGECKSQVLAGRVDHGWSLGFAITEEEKAQGYCLTCQARPLTSALALRPVRGMAPAAGRTVHARVVARTRLTPRVARLVLAPAKGEALHYEAGSYAEFVLPGIAPHRMYSFAGAPRADGLLEFFVARHPDGCASGYLNDRVQPGDHLELRGPFGSCRMPAGSGPVLGLAGGTGLAPVLAIFEHSLRAGDTARHTLLLSVREDDEVFALDRLHGLAALHPNFDFHVLATDAPSRFCARQQFAPEWLREHYPTLADHRAVIGGSPGFVQACAETCQALGLPASRIATDSFTPPAPTGLHSQGDTP